MFLAVAILKVVSKASLELADILMLFAYLTALQGGFLMGSYLQHRRRGS